MATDAQVARMLTEQMQRKGFECGQRYTTLGDQLPELVKSFPGESQATLRQQAEAVIQNTTYGFKVRRANGSLEISAKAAGPTCGS